MWRAEIFARTSRANRLGMGELSCWLKAVGKGPRILGLSDGKCPAKWNKGEENWGVRLPSKLEEGNTWLD